MNIPLIVAVPVVVLGAAGVATLPAPALLAWLVLGATAGGLTWAWARFSWTLAPAAARAAGVYVAAVATAAGLALAGSMVVLGAGTLVLLAGLSAWAVWAAVQRGPRPAQVQG